MPSHLGLVIPVARCGSRALLGLWIAGLCVASPACDASTPRSASPDDDGFPSGPASSADDLPSAPSAGDGPGGSNDAMTNDGAPAPRRAASLTPDPARPPGVIYRHELARATHDGRPPYLMQQLGPEAYKPNNRFVGWRITSVWPGDPQLCAPGCDLRPGDVIVTVNGQPIQYPEQLSDQMAKLDTMPELRVQMLRDGKLVKKTWTIVDP